MCLSHGRRQPSSPVLHYLDPDDIDEESETTTGDVSGSDKPVDYHELTTQTPILLASQVAIEGAEAVTRNDGNPCRNLSLAEREGMDFSGVMLWHRGVGALRDLLEELRSLNSWKFKRLPACLGEEIFARIFVMYRHIQVRVCDNTSCVQRKADLLAAAPPCSWQPFTELIATILSCWFPGFLWLLQDTFFQANPNQGFTETFHNLQSAGRQALCLDFIGIISTFQWSLRVAYGKEFITACQWVSGWEPQEAFNSTSYNIDETLWPGLSSMYEEQAVHASKLCQEAGMCSSRLWNVALLGSRGTADMIPLAQTAMRDRVGIGGQGQQHIECTDQTCQLSHNNSYIIKQLHKCQSNAINRCSVEIEFPRTLLNEAFKDGWTQSAWKVHSDYRASLCKPGAKYMAISHVWSDGTGVGLKDPGYVNKCLLDYFIRIAHSFGCDGIWWDTISIPEGKEERKIALSQMLRNYEMAEITLVHDQELVESKWDGDGRAAVALILSAWFTRGWTAAELFASRRHSVKVIFGNPDPTGPPIIKDLDEDIIVRDRQLTTVTDLFELKDTTNFELTRRQHVFSRFSKVPQLGHFIATDVVSRLRGGSSFDVSGLTKLSKDSETDPHHVTLMNPSIRNLLLVLRSRVTSWAKDRLLAPALMILPTANIDINDTNSQISQKILAHFKNIFLADIFHGSVPVSTTGPWSWSPPSIFDLGTSTASVSRYASQSFRVSDNGTITSVHPAPAIKVDKNDAIIPFSTHPAVLARILAALRANQDDCLLLPDKVESHHLYLLALPIWVRCHEDYSSLSCKWLGTVFVTNHSDVSASRREILQAKMIFGEDCDVDGRPRPHMQWKSARLTCEAIERCNWTREGFRWFISDGAEWQDGKKVISYVPQPVCIYPAGTSDVVLKKWERTRDWKAAATSFVTVTFTLDRDENVVDPSVLDLIPKDAISIVEVCDYDRHSQCQGIVDLTWAFPCADECTYDYGLGTIQRRVWKSTFHIIQEELRDRELCIGLNTFLKCIRPHIKVGRDATKENSQSLNPNDDDDLDEFIYSATFPEADIIEKDQMPEPSGYRRFYGAGSETRSLNEPETDTQSQTSSHAMQDNESR